MSVQSQHVNIDRGVGPGLGVICLVLPFGCAELFRLVRLVPALNPHEVGHLVRWVPIKRCD
jgi:hypothetical protein